MTISPRHLLAVALLVALWALAAAAAPRFEPPGESPEAAALRKTIQTQLAQGRVEDAAGELDKLFALPSVGLLSVDKSGLMSATAWLATLPAQEREKLGDAYRKLFDGPAKDAYDALRRDPGATAEELYQVAQRYPLASAANSAYAEAGSRAARVGDVAAAVAFFDLARRSGWKGEVDGALKAAMARMRERTPLEGAWHSGAVRYVPAAAAGVLYFAGPRDVIAIRENGEIIWRWVSPARRAGDRIIERGWIDTYTPALFRGMGGAQVLVVRQPRNTSSEYCLRAFRASDGKLLWNGDDNPAVERISAAGRPAVSGRYVYSIGVQWGENVANLVLTAFDLMDGHVIHTTSLGTVLSLRHRKQERDMWEEIWDQSEPAVVGDAIYLTPNVGVAYCVGRFDGKVRWTRIYEEEGVGRVWRDPRSSMPRDERAAAAPAGEPGQRSRTRSTPQVCGEAMVIAPQDSPAVAGLNAATGEVLWTNSASSSGTLWAAADAAAIFYGGNIVEAVDPATGKSKWRYGQAAGQPRPSGPPSLAGDVLAVPAHDGIVHAVDPLTGKAVAKGIKSIAMRPVLASPAAKKALEEASLLRSSGAPPARR